MLQQIKNKLSFVSCRSSLANLFSTYLSDNHQAIFLKDCFFCSENIMFSTDELSQIKRVSNGQLRLLGFKPLDCLKDYHNLRPSTFIFPTDEVIMLPFYLRNTQLSSSLVFIISVISIPVSRRLENDTDVDQQCCC